MKLSILFFSALINAAPRRVGLAKRGAAQSSAPSFNAHDKATTILNLLEFASIQCSECIGTKEYDVPSEFNFRLNSMINILQPNSNDADGLRNTQYLLNDLCHSYITYPSCASCVVAKLHSLTGNEHTFVDPMTNILTDCSKNTDVNVVAPTDQVKLAFNSMTVDIQTHFEYEAQPRASLGYRKIKTFLNLVQQCSTQCGFIPSSDYVLNTNLDKGYQAALMTGLDVTKTTSAIKDLLAFTCPSVLKVVNSCNICITGGTVSNPKDAQFALAVLENCNNEDPASSALNMMNLSDPFINDSVSGDEGKKLLSVTQQDANLFFTGRNY